MSANKARRIKVRCTAINSGAAKRNKLPGQDLTVMPCFASRRCQPYLSLRLLGSYFWQSSAVLITIHARQPPACKLARLLGHDAFLKSSPSLWSCAR